MSRFLALMFVCVTALLPAIASAQDVECPPGEMCELRSDDSHCGDGYRCFVFGSFVAGSHASLNRMLATVNHDFDDASDPVTMEQMEAANPCSVIYHSHEAHSALNGSCLTYNHTSERVTFETYSAEHDASRWPMAHHVYRVPSVPHLTPGEEAEHLAREIDAAAITGTVRAPDWIGPRITRIRELISSHQLTDSQSDAMLASLERSLGRVPAETSTAAPEADPAQPDMEFSPEETGATEESVTPPPTEEHAAVQAAAPVYMNPWFWIAVLCALGIGMLLGRRGRKVVTMASEEDAEELASLREEKAALTGKLAAANTSLMNAKANHEQEIGDFKDRLSKKRADDASESAENGNNKTFVETFTKRWNEFYASVDPNKVVRKLNGANIINLFSDLELFVIVERAWDEKVFGPMNRPSIEKALSPHKSKRIEQLEADLREKGIDLATANARASELEAMKGDLTTQLEAAKSEASNRTNELVEERTARMTAETKADTQESQLFELAGVIQSIQEGTEELFDKFFNKSDGSPTWPHLAKETLEMVRTVLDAANLRAAPLIDALLGSSPMVGATAGGAPLESVETQITLPPSGKRGRINTSPLGIERPANGNGSHGRDDRWSSDPPIKPGRKPTLPPAAGEGLYRTGTGYGPTPGLHADGVPPESVESVLAAPAKPTNGTKEVTDPSPATEQPEAAPGTVPLIDGVDETPTRPSSDS